MKMRRSFAFPSDKNEGPERNGAGPSLSTATSPTSRENNGRRQKPVGTCFTGRA